MRNPYFIDEPCIISDSGGRSSKMMTAKIVEAHGGKLPDYVVPVFCNTGKEDPATLNFVRDCADYFDYKVTWIELESMEAYKKNGKNAYRKTYKIVDYDSASRNGEPFQVLIDAMPALPNVVNMSCTAYLKTRIMRMFADDLGLERGCLTAIGMRADEPGRVANAHGKKIEGFEGYCPLYVDGVSKAEVTEFWRNQNIDLALPNNKGVTDKGNCDLCFKKSRHKLASIILEDPSKADWWIQKEAEKNQVFRKDGPSYQQLKIIATDQGNLFDYEEDSISCFC